MSGMVGMLNLDGGPVDGRLLSRMTEYLTFRGPDRQHVHVAKNAGLGHALLKVTEESEHDDQPLTLDGRQWIVADARVDRRQELIAELRPRDPRALPPPPPHPELILPAYPL